MAAFFLSSIIPAFLTFIFWIFVAKTSGSEIIGIVIAVTSLSMIITTVSNLDIGVGIRRYLGQAFFDKNWEGFKQISFSSIVFAFLASVGVLIIVFNPIFDILNLIGIDKKFFITIIFVVIGNSLINTTNGILTSALKNTKIIIPTSISSASRFVVLFSIIYFYDISELIVAYAYTAYYPILGTFMIIITAVYLKSIPGKIKFNPQKLKLVLRGSLANWVPNVTELIGIQMGILTIFALKGGSETGLFYITFAIFNVVNMIPGAINVINHPVFSGLRDLEKQKNHLERTIKLTYLITIPVASVVLFYSEIILGIIGESFIVAKEILMILVISLPIIILVDGIWFLIYARGSYKEVIIMGLTANLTRIVLYILLVPEFSGVGTAIAFIGGYVVQLGITLLFIKKLKLGLNYPKFAVISIIPLSIGYLVNLFEFQIFGVVIILVSTFAVYVKTKLLDQKDLNSIFKIIMKEDNALQYSEKFMNSLKKIHLA
jgi:O-antigen/teichoic acid export membrane protein